MSLFDQVSPDDMKALGNAFGDALGSHLAPAIRDALQDALQKYESVTFEVTIRLNKKD